MRFRALLIVTTLLAWMATPAIAPAAKNQAANSTNMSHVANLPYELKYGQNTPYGTDVEFVSLDVTGLEGAGDLQGTRDFALAGTYRNGLQIVDITNPATPVIAAVYDCAIAQGDVQIFDRDGRTYVTFTLDGGYGSQTNVNSECFRTMNITQAAAGVGTFIADITNPYRPATVAHVPVVGGSHNQTVHPSGNYLYNSNSNSSNNLAGNIEVFDISNFSSPVMVEDLQVQTGSDSHDITFNESGTRAYSAALDHTLIIDTTDPADPTIIGRIIDPALDIHHQSDPVTIDDPILGERTFLIITDEWRGGGTGYYCPGGGLHVYDITGELENNPVKVGFFAIPETQAGTSLACTSHVLRIYPEQKIITIAWYNAGVRVLDISGLAGVSVGDQAVGSQGMGIKQIGYYMHTNADTWSAKAYRFEEDGSFYLFANDIARSFDVYRFDASAAPAQNPGRWLSPQNALREARLRRGKAPNFARPFCLVGTR